MNLIPKQQYCINQHEPKRRTNIYSAIFCSQCLSKVGRPKTEVKDQNKKV